MSATDNTLDDSLIYVRFLEKSIADDGRLEVVTSYGWTTLEELTQPLAKVLREDLLSITLIQRKSEYVKIMETNKKMSEKLKMQFDWSLFYKE